MKLRKLLVAVMVLMLMLTLTACGDVLDATVGALNGGNGGNGGGLSGAKADDWWLGDWYGWWVVFDGTGYYEDFIGSYWDCCGYFEEAGDGDYYLTLWDEDFNDYSDECLAWVKMEIDPNAGSNRHGMAFSVDFENNFFWNARIKEGQWVIDPDDTEGENMLVIENSFVDADGEYCEFGVILCKWGEEWNLEDGDYPDYYESYFVPMMERGEALPVIFEPY